MATGIGWKDFQRVLEMVRWCLRFADGSVLHVGHAERVAAVELKEAGLTAYNHNLDTSPEFYGNVITTRTYDDRLQTIAHVRKAGITVCCGGILGNGGIRRRSGGAARTTRASRPSSGSVPINMLVANAGTPLADAEELDPLTMVRMIAAARILMPRSRVTGRRRRQRLRKPWRAAFGRRAIFIGEKLLTTPNPAADADHQLLASLGMRAEQSATRAAR